MTVVAVVDTPYNQRSTNKEKKEINLNELIGPYQVPSLKTIDALISQVSGGDVVFDLKLFPPSAQQWYKSTSRETVEQNSNEYVKIGESDHHRSEIGLMAMKQS